MFEKSQCFCAGIFDGELEVEVGGRQAGKKAGGEKIAILTPLCLRCCQWERTLALGLLMWSPGNSTLEHVS